ncbi:phospholipid-transporting ATPase, putative [Plasmodium sp. gorilla clade G2]|uniref:phospholipid-transporting ATPase, putative n=1 Tax=Plasmodium sp. gorilla clade G2 TaxID=880535 RepID=UPI000D1FF27F|nr:phospholipid-transporting ATPase, putative [Plasmodium sp. gorilla clade G2]SOV16882.1 phospholipid-transporting ATPase, putative [Plasmodium sp. gorilla clade G2]
MVDDEELRKLRFLLSNKGGRIKYFFSYIFYKLFSHVYNKKNKKRERFVNIHGRTFPNFFCDNKIKSTKYTILTFIPLFLFYQFADFLNLFYLCVSLLQIIPIFNTGYVFTFVAPLLFIIFISLINEVVDDLKRFIKDLENNNEIYYSLLENGNFQKIYSKDIRVGDIILIKSKQRVPADCILLRNLNKNEESNFKVEEKRFFNCFRWNKSNNVYNKINKSYYHFNKNIDNELIDDRFNESNNNCSETSNNLLFSENEKSQKKGKKKQKKKLMLGDKNTNMNDDLNFNPNDQNNDLSKQQKKKKKRKNKNKNKKKNININETANETANYTYVKTDKIDGETDWKIKYPINIFQNLKRLKDFFTIDILFILEQPKNDIYKIEGSFVIFKYNPYGDFKTVENNNHSLNDNQLLNYSFDMAKEDEGRAQDEEDVDDDDYDDDDDEDDDDEDDDDEDDDDEDDDDDEEEDEEDEEVNIPNNEQNDKQNLEDKKSVKMGFGTQNNTYSYGDDDEIQNEKKKKMLDRGYVNLEEKDTDYAYNKKEKKKEMVTFIDVEKGNNERTINLNNKKNSVNTGGARSSYVNDGKMCNVFNNEDNFNFYNVNYRKKLNYDNFILFNSVITSSDVICLVIYTGSDTRVNMSTQISKIKRGMIDEKLNLITLFLFIILTLFSIYMCSVKLNNLWYLNFIRFMLLFSSVIPISLSVNLNIAKIYYTLLIQRDKEVESTIIKNSGIIENFGDIDYIFTDKTGTLTENVMVLKVIHIGFDVIHAENEKNSIQGNNMENKQKGNYNKKMLSYNLDDMNEDVDDTSIYLASSNYSKHDRRNKNLRNGEIASFTYEMENTSNLNNNNNNNTKLRNYTKSNNQHNNNNSDNELYDEKNYNDDQRSLSNFSDTSYGDVHLKNYKQNNMILNQNMGQNRNEKLTKSNNNMSLEKKKKKVEKMVDEFLKYKSDPLDYYNDNIDDIEYLKRHRVFQTFLSFLICNNIRTLTKESSNKEKEKTKKKKERKEKDFQKNLYYILKVNRKKKDMQKNKKETNSDNAKSSTQNKKKKHFSSNSSEDSETFSHSDVSYQCSSPDELAFLKYATNCGFILKKKTASKIEIKYKNIMLEYDILLHIPFSSETKRMSIFVRNVKNRNIYFFIKGADNVLIKKCHEKYKTFIYEESDHLSNIGLRVLVHGCLNIEEQFFHNFSALYNKNKDVKGQLENILEYVEKNIKVLAITGVEDKLQEGVGKTIEMLYNSGIKVWVLTGDKIETAICICKNANIKKKKHNIYIFRHENIKSTSNLIREFNSILHNIESYVLFFDNIIIQNCIKYIPNAFVDFAANARAVVCCRCSPIEKKEIAVLIKTIKKKKILCIGDGGNDVAMIQSADIGIGVLGKEGKQVVHDSDIIVSKFKNIKKLILYYGNNTFLQTSSLCSFLIHRGFILTYLQFIYSYIFFSIPVSIFQGWLQIGYTTYYTTAPFLSLLLDIKIKKNLIYLYPEIYKNKKHKRKLDLKSFFIIVWISIFQGTVVMLGALKLFNDNYNNLINISFSSLIVLEIMNIHLEVESWHPLMISANICSFIVYIFSMFILRNYFDIMQIMSVMFWYKVILIVIFAWLPFFIIKKVKNIITPSQFFKLA